MAGSGNTAGNRDRQVEKRLGHTAGSGEMAGAMAGSGETAGAMADRGHTTGAQGWE